MTYRLELRDVVKSFGKFKANDGVNLRIAEGSIHVVLGENGAGKSTLIKLLSGIHPHGSYEGELHVDGRTVKFANIRDAAGKFMSLTEGTVRVRVVDSEGKRDSSELFVIHPTNLLSLTTSIPDTRPMT